MCTQLIMKDTHNVNTKKFKWNNIIYYKSIMVYAGAKQNTNNNNNKNNEIKALLFSWIHTLHQTSRSQLQNNSMNPITTPLIF